MLGIYRRNVLKEIAVSFVLTLAFLNSVLMMEKILRLSRVLSGVGASMVDLAKIIILLQPQLLLLTIPMSLLLATLIVYGRMNIDGELVILRACGLDFRSISVPVFIFGAGCFLVATAVSFSLSPKSSQMLRKEIGRIISVRTTLAIEEGTFNTSFQNVVIMAKSKRPPDILENIFIYDTRKEEEPRILIAAEGRLTSSESSLVSLHLKDGYINMTRGSRITEIFFKGYRVNLEIQAQAPSQKLAEHTPMELYLLSLGAESEEDRIALLLELHRRVTLPVLCLLLTLLAPPLSLVAGKTGKLGGLSVGLAVFAIFYMILIYGENLVRAGTLPHYAGAWLPVAVFTVFGIFMFRRGDFA